MFNVSSGMRKAIPFVAIGNFKRSAIKRIALWKKKRKKKKIRTAKKHQQSHLCRRVSKIHFQQLGSHRKVWRKVKLDRHVCRLSSLPNLASNVSAAIIISHGLFTLQRLSRLLHIIARLRSQGRNLLRRGSAGAGPHPRPRRGGFGSRTQCQRIVLRRWTNNHIHTL